MKRVFAVVVLAAFAVGPALPCVLSCARAADHAAAAESCHSKAASEQSVDGGRDCADHGMPVALVAKRGEASSDIFITALADASLGMLAAFAPLETSGRDAYPPTRPLTSFLVPLRI